jgi:hypothetical protein
MKKSIFNSESGSTLLVVLLLSLILILIFVFNYQFENKELHITNQRTSSSTPTAGTKDLGTSNATTSSETDRKEGGTEDKYISENEKQEKQIATDSSSDQTIATNPEIHSTVSEQSATESETGTVAPLIATAYVQTTIEQSVARDEELKSKGVSLEESKIVHAPLPVPVPIPKNEEEQTKEKESADDELGNLNNNQKTIPLVEQTTERDEPVPYVSTVIDSVAGISGGGTPPDTHGAVGPNHLLAITNGSVKITPRNGGAVTTVSLNSFFSGLPITSGYFDPKAIFDPLTNRFMVVGLTSFRTGNSGVAIAVSTTSDAISWHKWFFDYDSTNAYWADYPYIGTSSNKIVISINRFAVANDQFDGIELFIFDKTNAINGGTMNATTASRLKLTGSSWGGSHSIALNYDSDVANVYAVRKGTNNAFGFGRLQAYVLTGSVQSPTYTTIPSQTLGQPWSISIPDAPQPTTNSLIQTNDDRTVNAVYRSGSIWTAQTVAFPAWPLVTDRAAIHWWEFSSTDGSGIQDGFIQDSNEDVNTRMHYYYPSIAVNKDNDVMIGFSCSSKSNYVSTCYTTRRSSDPAGQTDPVTMIKAGSGVYTGPRWGDYSATVVDPLDDTKFWTIQEYASGTNQVGTWWGQVAKEIDTTSPEVSSANAQSSSAVRIVFNEAMLNNAALRDTANYSFSGGGVALTPTLVTVISPTTVDLTVNQMTGSSNYTVTVSSNVSDLSGNALNSGASSANFVGVATPITVSLSSTATSSTKVSPIPVTVLFSTSVTGFAVDDLTLTNATVSNFTGTGTSYSFNLTPSAQGTVQVSVNANAVVDAGQNTNGTGATLVRTYDSIAPVPTISTSASNPTNIIPIPVTVSFQEAVTDFIDSDVNITNGTLSNFQTLSASSYSFDVIPAAEGLVTISIPASAAKDAANNLSQASNTLSLTYDDTSVGVTITNVTASPTNSSPINFSVTFGDNVVGFINSDITVTNGSVTSFSGSGSSYTFSVTPAGQGNVSVSIPFNVAQDNLGNPNAASGILTVAYDTVRPTASITSAVSNPTNSSSFAVQISLNETVKVFNQASLVTENATISGFSGSGLSYSFTLNVTGQGLARVEIPVNALEDFAGNKNNINYQLTRTFDSIPPPNPSISISQ